MAMASARSVAISIVSAIVAVLIALLLPTSPFLDNDTLYGYIFPTGELLEPVSELHRDAYQPPPPLDFDALSKYTAANSKKDLRWGTYRSGLYLGIRSRTYPYFVSAGLLWGTNRDSISQLRHECRQEDRLQKYGWLQHDGRNYGRQSIEDQYNHVQLETYYTRLHHQDANGLEGWATRIAPSYLEPRDKRMRKTNVKETEVSLFFYIDLECGDEKLEDECRRHIKETNMEAIVEPMAPTSCDDDTTDMCMDLVLKSTEPTSESDVDFSNAPFSFQVRTQLRTKQHINKPDLRFAGYRSANLLNVKEKLVKQSVQDDKKGDRKIVLDNTVEDDSTLLVIQATFIADISHFHPNDVTFDIAFDERQKETAGIELHDLLSAEIMKRSTAFNDRFEQVFRLSEKSMDSSLVDDKTADRFNASHIAFAQAAFSQLMGGISYFYGTSLVQRDPSSPEVVETDARPLFTAVPSRSFFPRGFIWDEGFHQMGISMFDQDISRDILAHWLGLMEESGYIAREQIRGESSRRRVPSEFLVQHVEHANPPTLLLFLDKLLARSEDVASMKEFVHIVMPFLERWYRWMAQVQRGPKVEKDRASFRWRGRDPYDGKLIANTLSSGLDDYPRASSVSDEEMHVDLTCWMIKASDILSKLAMIVDEKDKAKALTKDRQRFLNGLFEYHWSDKYGAFFDVGEHSEDGRIEYHAVIRCRNAQGQVRDVTAPPDKLDQRAANCPPSYPTYMFPMGDGKGKVVMQPVYVSRTIALQHVTRIGYVSMFPLLLKLLPPDAPELLISLKRLTSPDHLWTPFGLRSLSAADTFYEQENAPGDAPYWRGSVWICGNYLALEALYHYAQPSTNSPYQDQFAAAYNALRTNVISNIYREYDRTGYLWEQYNGNFRATGDYGHGQRVHPFAGWTSLVVNIMAETY